MNPKHNFEMATLSETLGLDPKSIQTLDLDLHLYLTMKTCIQV
jgi:hypothetical protein